MVFVGMALDLSGPSFSSIDQIQTESRDSIHAKVGTHLQVKVCEKEEERYI